MTRPAVEGRQGSMAGEAPSACDAGDAPAAHRGCGSRRSRTWVQHAGAFAAANTGTIVGLGLGWTSAALAVRNGAQGMPVSLSEWSWITSVFCIGAALGAGAVFKLVLSLGRRAVLLAVGPVTIVAWALHLWASSVWMLYVGRLLLGAACGAACVANPIFVAEMAEPRIRGALCSYFEILLCVGILIVYALGKLLPVFWMNFTCLAVSVVHVVGFVWFPDTPRWHLIHGRADEARKSLVFYRGPHYDVDGELALLRAGVKEGSMSPTGWQAFAARSAKKSLAITVMLMLMQQITGVNAITFYATQLFQETGSFDAYTASIVVGAVEVASAVVSMFFVDLLGRRVMLIFSGASMALCTGLMGGYFYFKDVLGQDVSIVSWLPVLLASVYMFTFTLGWGTVVWALLGELVPDNIKGVVTGISAASGWSASFLITKFYPGVVADLGNHTCYWGFCAFNILACVFVAVCVPETKGKTLDEVHAAM